MILVGDIGATKADLGLFELQNKTLKLKRQAKLASQEFPSLELLLRKFLGADLSVVKSGCLAIAGVVLEEKIMTPNVSWEVIPAELRQSLGLRSLHLINDLYAMAYALPTQRKENLEILQSGIERSGNRAVIAAGTGLGEALLFGDGKAWFPSASEGGHSDFAPTNEQQIDLLRFLQKKFDHISYERLLSGSGLQEIYNFVCSREKSTMGELLTAQQISDAALQKKSSQSIEALEIFVTIYAAEAANLVLKAMAIGGVYLGGGITEKILPLLKGKIFLQAFQNKGRYRQLMQEIPIKVLINPKVGPSVAMEGALNYLMSRA